MSITLLNKTFQDWNQGSSFVNPAPATETADNWYAGAFGGSACGIYEQSSGIRITNSDTSECGIYQQGTFTPDLQGRRVMVSFTVARVSGSNVRVKTEGTFGGHFTETSFIVLSGTDQVTYSFSFVVGSANTDFTISLVLNGEASAMDVLHVSILPPVIIEDEITFSDDYDYTNKSKLAEDSLALVDSLSIELNPVLQRTHTDAVGFEDFVDIDVTGKGPQDGLLIQDWVRVRKNAPQSNWS